MFFSRRGKLSQRSFVSVRLEHRGKASEFTALLDTGNALSDPISGKRVMVVAAKVLLPVFGKDSPLLSCKDAVSIMQSSAKDPMLCGRLRLIPYSALGGGGLLPAFEAERLYTDGREEKDILVAISPRLSGDDFDAII